MRKFGFHQKNQKNTKAKQPETKKKQKTHEEIWFSPEKPKNTKAK